ncbi:MAG: hypothetical protein P8Y81_12635 [Ignavibacteriaceae bacterium]
MFGINHHSTGLFVDSSYSFLFAFISTISSAASGLSLFENSYIEAINRCT